MRRIVLVLTFLVSSILLGGCFELRTGSVPQQTEIAAGRTQAAQTLAPYLPTPARGTGTPEPPGNIFTQVAQNVPNIGDNVEAFVLTSQPNAQATIALGEPLFYTVTIGSGTWTKNYLFRERGDHPTPSIYSVDLGPMFASTLSTKWVATVTHDVELPVYETAVEGNFYYVQLSGWVELTDLVNRGSVALDNVHCTPHGGGHVDDETLCHGHLFSIPEAVEGTEIALIEDGTLLSIEKVDLRRRMAYVKLPPLWMDSGRTTGRP